MCACAGARGSDFNPRSPHGERRNAPKRPIRASRISTHAPRTGSDPDIDVVLASQPISTHAPRTGSDETDKPIQMELAHFNPRSPHGERPGRWRRRVQRRISTHAPRTGSDRGHGRPECAQHHFNPRSPHGERRSRVNPSSLRRAYFNPRSPHGERRRNHFGLCI